MTTGLTALTIIITIITAAAGGANIIMGLVATFVAGLVGMKINLPCLDYGIGICICVHDRFSCILVSIALRMIRMNDQHQRSWATTMVLSGAVNFISDAMFRTMKIEDITSDDINRKILRSLKENNNDDPDFEYTSIFVTSDIQRPRNQYIEYNDYNLQTSLEFMGLGYYIGKNTKLQGLSFMFKQSFMFQQGIESHPLSKFSSSIKPFCRGINSNKSIASLTFSGLDLTGDFFQSLGPLFRDNGNLSRLDILTCEFGGGCARELSLAIGDCDKSLKCIRLTDNMTKSGELGDIIVALCLRTELEVELELSGLNIGKEECSSLSAIIDHHATKLLRLKLDHNAIGDGGLDILAGAVANSRIQRLDLSENNICTAKTCGLLLETSSNLEILCLEGNQINNEGAILLANALHGNRSLKILYLNVNNICDGGAQAFADTLAGNSCSLEVLELEKNNNIGSEGACAIANALCNNCSLKQISLAENNIGNTGAQAFADALAHSNCSLEVLNLGANNIFNEGALAIANALTNNNKLNHLYLHQDRITNEVWPIFSKLLCDTSSINATFLSNHTLQFCGDIDYDDDVDAYLTLNLDSDKTLIAMNKILKYHANFDMAPFLQWNWKLLPIVVEWFERAHTSFVDNSDNYPYYDLEGDDLGLDNVIPIDEERIKNEKLNAIYQFINGYPVPFERLTGAGANTKAP